MADFFTHFVSARIPAGFVRDRRLQALFVLGTFLPDFGSKGLYWVMAARDGFGGPTHSLLGVLLLSYLVCLFVEAPLRRAGWMLMSVGGVIHLLVDLLKSGPGEGGRDRNFFFPMAWSLPTGAIDPENVILLLPIDAAILAVWLLWERRRDRVRR